MRKIPTKNYVIVLVICLFTIAIVCYLAYWFTEKDSYQSSDQVMSSFLFEFGQDEVINNVENYVLDNPDCILYLSYGRNDDTKKFELDLKSFIEQNNLKSSFVYINLGSIKNKKFLAEFSDKFFSQELKDKKANLLKQSNILIFRDGVVSDMLYYTNQDININDVRLFLLDQGVVEND